MTKASYGIVISTPLFYHKLAKKSRANKGIFTIYGTFRPKNTSGYGAQMRSASLATLCDIRISYLTKYHKSGNGRKPAPATIHQNQLNMRKGGHPKIDIHPKVSR